MTLENENIRQLKFGRQHTDRPNVFYFLSTAHFLKLIFGDRTNGTFVLPNRTFQRFASQKSRFFDNAKFSDITEQSVQIFYIFAEAKILRKNLILSRF